MGTLNFWKERSSADTKNLHIEGFERIIEISKGY